MRRAVTPAGSRTTRPGMRLSVATQFILESLLADPHRERPGRELGRAAGLRTGAIRPVLARLEAVGWVQSRWEDPGPVGEGRPARRCYRLSAAGAAAAREALAASGHPVRTTPWGTPLAGPT